MKKDMNMKELAIVWESVPHKTKHGAPRRGHATHYRMSIRSVGALSHKR